MSATVLNEAPNLAQARPIGTGRQTHCWYRGVFGEALSREIYQLALHKQSVFAPSRTSPSRLYPDWRRSTVIYDNQLGGIYGTLQQAVLQRLPKAMARLGIGAFEIDAIELQLTSHNDGDYYHWHTDNGTPETAARTVTFVYYLHGQPKAFSGGELVLYGDDGSTETVQPENDSLVLFSSSRRHEVLPVSCPSRRFEDGRFTLNGWVRWRLPQTMPDHFGYWIFSPPQEVVPRARGDQPVGAPARSRQSQQAETANVDAAAVASHAVRVQALQSALHRTGGTGSRIAECDALSPEEFFADYYFANRPVVIRGALKDSPAVRTWTPELLRQRYGKVEVDVTSGRDADGDYERNFRRTLRKVSMAELVDRVLGGPSNDTYLVARNYFFDQEALRPLRAQLQPPSGIVNTDDEGAGTVKFWFGPDGTVTPLHFDEHSILFAQIYGRKRFWFVPPFDSDKVYMRDRFYSAVDVEAPDLAQFPAFGKASVALVEVGPGDLLFIPVAWWHHVRSLSASMSATFCSFRVEGGNTRL